MEAEGEGHCGTRRYSDRGIQGEHRRVRTAIAPIGIEGDAWDIAQAALFLAGPESRFITGITIPVDGGVTVVGPLAAYERVTAEGSAGT
jgi:NAD(P)-dependent dehydrogenase (short-subunit alcohol dehydrogenase family)